MTPVDDREHLVWQAVDMPPSNDEEYRPTGGDEKTLEQ